MISTYGRPRPGTITKRKRRWGWGGRPRVRSYGRRYDVGLNVVVYCNVVTLSVVDSLRDLFTLTLFFEYVSESWDFRGSLLQLTSIVLFIVSV